MSRASSGRGHGPSNLVALTVIVTGNLGTLSGLLPEKRFRAVAERTQEGRKQASRLAGKGLSGQADDGSPHRVHSEVV